MEKINEYSRLMHFQTFLFDDTREGFDEMVKHKEEMGLKGYSVINKSLKDGKRRVHYMKSEDLQGSVQNG